MKTVSQAMSRRQKKKQPKAYLKKDCVMRFAAWDDLTLGDHVILIILIPDP